MRNNTLIQKHICETTERKDSQCEIFLLWDVYVMCIECNAALLEIILVIIIIHIYIYTYIYTNCTQQYTHASKYILMYSKYVQYIFQ